MKQRKKLLFKKLDLLSKQNHWQRNDVAEMKTATPVYCRIRNCYETLREYINFPHPNTCTSRFRKLDILGSVTDC